MRGRGVKRRGGEKEGSRGGGRRRDGSWRFGFRKS